MRNIRLSTKRLKKVMVLALTFSMTIGAVPFGVYAEEPSNPEEIIVEACSEPEQEITEDSEPVVIQEDGIQDELQTIEAVETVNVEDGVNVVDEVNGADGVNGGTSGDGGDNGLSTPKYKEGSIVIDSRPSNPSDGAQTEYEFSFKADDDAESNIYGYVYGMGVNDNVCELLAKSYFDAYIDTYSHNKIIASNQEFIDANKSSVNHQYNNQYDSSLCWAYSASNALVQTEWIKKANAGIFNGDDGTAAQYFTSEDALASYAAYCLVNEGNNEENFWNWIFNGNSVNLKFGDDVDDALLHEYYVSGLYGENPVNESSFKELLSDYMLNMNAANTMDIYYLNGGGGHAMSINGFMCAEDGTLLAVIVTDPDDMVRMTDQPDDPALKSKAYSVFPIAYNGTNWIFSPDDTYDVRIGYMSTIIDSAGKEKVNPSIVPDATRAISADFDNDSEYSMDGRYTFDIPLNFDFLSFYDINKLKYRVLNERDEIIAEKSVEKSKSQWKSLFDSNAVNVSLIFDEALGNAQNGKYKIQVEIDKDCFFGNYGWFAENANYFDRLVDVWVNLFRGNSVPSNTADDSSSKSVEQSAQESVYEGVDDAIYEGVNESVDEAVYVSVMESFLNEILAQIDVDYIKLTSNEAETVEFDDMNASNISISEAAIKENVRIIVSDLLKLNAADANAVEAFKAVGIDAANIDIQKLDVMLSTAVNVTRPCVVRISSNRIGNLGDKEVIAMIKMSDGTYRYVKAVVLADGSIEVSLPENAVEMTLVSLTKKGA